MAMHAIQAIVLAAGKAQRFNIGKTKLLFTLCGQEMIIYATKVLEELNIPTTVVTGFQGNLVQETINHYHNNHIKFIEQEKQHGTGHAVLCTRSAWQEDHILVLNGDMPLITPDIICTLFEEHSNNNASISFVIAENTELKSGYGRIVKKDNAIKIIEAKEFSGSVHEHPFINAGIYLFKRTFLEQYIEFLKTNRVSNELHIPDLVALASEQKKPIVTVTVPFDDIRGINTLKELWQAEQVKQTNIINHWMENGVRFLMPTTTCIDLNVCIGAGSVVEGNVSLLGNTTIGNNCHIQQGARLTNVILADEATIQAYSVIEETNIESNAIIGPYAHIHSKSHIGEKAVVGNFVEIKQSTLDDKSKAKHLSYLGNAKIGKEVNIGAGTITCNYDGRTKHQTTIKDNAFIGSDTIIVAPVTIAENSYTAAGSVITQDVPANALAIARSHQTIKEDYANRIRKPSEKLSKKMVKPTNNHEKIIEP